MGERSFKVFVDEKIVRAKEVFGAFGQVTLFDGYEAKRDPSILRDANLLITRSVTPIDGRLLEACPNLLLLASPTIGTDHVDFEALEEYGKKHGREVPFFHAPGATASGVADFTLAAILVAARHFGVRPTKEKGYALPWKVGIWGFGNCGSALGRRLSYLGIPFVAYDPPKAEREGFKSGALEEVLQCDVITLHVTLTTPKMSKWPTYHMIDRKILGTLSKNTKVFINTSRGAVVDSKAFKEFLETRSDLFVAFDVWEGEPNPDPSLVALCSLATPHSAGSVIEGRLRSVRMVYEATRKAFFPKAPPPPPFLEARSNVGPFRFPEALEAYLHAVGIEALSRDFKGAYLRAEEGEGGLIFDKMRIERIRHEVLWPFDV